MSYVFLLIFLKIFSVFLENWCCGSRSWSNSSKRRYRLIIFLKFTVLPKTYEKFFYIFCWNSLIEWWKRDLLKIINLSSQQNWNISNCHQCKISWHSVLYRCTHRNHRSDISIKISNSNISVSSIWVRLRDNT